MNAPRDDLFRMQIPAGELRFTDDGNTLVGYVARFNTPTEINSWEGRFMETIAPGAFAKTIQERGSKIKVLFDHGFDPSIGNKPVASVRSLTEDEHGLRLEAAFVDRPYAHDIREAIRSGAIDGMSFRFSVTREDWDDDNDLPVRTLREVKLYEVGPVTFPAYEATSVGVRSAAAYQLWRTHTHQDDPLDEPDAATRTSGDSNDTPPPGHLSDSKKARIQARLDRIRKETAK